MVLQPFSVQLGLRLQVRNAFYTPPAGIFFKVEFSYGILSSVVGDYPAFILNRSPTLPSIPHGRRFLTVVDRHTVRI